jgi:hypothetical protein
MHFSSVSGEPNVTGDVADGKFKQLTDDSSVGFFNLLIKHNVRAPTAQIQL